MSFLSWLADHSREPDSVTADTRAWLDHETRGEQAARAELLAEHVRHGATKAELRSFQRKYGAASAVIGQLRAELARERERARGQGMTLSVQHGDPAEAARAATLALRLSRDPITPLSKQVADAAVVDTAERLGNEIQADRTAAIEGAAITLRAHQVDVTHHEGDGKAVSVDCTCGKRMPPTIFEHHVAEQLAAVGALGNLQLSVESSVESSVASSPVLVDRDGDEWLPRPDGSYYCFTEDISRTSRHELEASYGPLAEKAATS